MLLYCTICTFLKYNPSSHPFPRYNSKIYHLYNSELILLQQVILSSFYVGLLCSDTWPKRAVHQPILKRKLCSVFKSKYAVGKLLLVLYPVYEYVVKQRGGEAENITLCCQYCWVFRCKISFDPELKSLWTCLTEQDWDNRPPIQLNTCSHRRCMHDFP